MKRFLIGFAVVAVLVAGLVSYLASGDPDGLDAATRHGCEVIETEAGGSLSGECAARSTEDHALADGPLADYTVGGNDGLTGVAGVVGVIVTAGLAGGLFWLLRRRTKA